MGSGERPIGATKGKQVDPEALLQPPPLWRKHGLVQATEVRPGGFESQCTTHRIVAYRKHACLPRHRSWARIPVGRPLGVLFTGSSSQLNPVPAEGQGGTPDLPRRTVAAPPAPYLWTNCDGGFAAMPGNALNERA